jgi:hypothetical protein
MGRVLTMPLTPTAEWLSQVARRLTGLRNNAIGPFPRIELPVLVANQAPTQVVYAVLSHQRNNLRLPRRSYQGHRHCWNSLFDPA